MRILFMGSPAFAVPTLQALATEHNLVAVVTQPDRPAGRGRKLTPPPAKLAALDLGLVVFQPTNLRYPTFLSKLAELSPDLIIVAAYGLILPEPVLDFPPHGSLNVHASLLPRWRGAAPAQASILHGDHDTGVTIMQMDPGLDTGPILSQVSTPIMPDETGGQLTTRLSLLGAQLLTRTLPDWFEGRITPRPQDDQQATYAPMLKKSDGILIWTKPASQLARQVRAFNPWPGSYFLWSNRRIAVHQAHMSSKETLPPGRAFLHGDALAITASDGALVLDIVQPAGRKPMPSEDFLRGNHAILGQDLLGTNFSDCD